MSADFVHLLTVSLAAGVLALATSALVFHRLRPRQCRRARKPVITVRR